MRLSNWAVTYEADGDDINETTAERMCVYTHVCVCVRVCQREKERDKVKGGVRKVKRDQNDSLA